MTTRKYFIKSVPQISDCGAIRFVQPEAVPVSRAQTGTWYLADDNGDAVTFEDSKPYGIKFEYALFNALKFATRKQFRMTDFAGKQVRNLKLA